MSRWWVIAEDELRSAIHRALVDDPDVVLLELLANSEHESPDPDIDWPTRAREAEEALALFGEQDAVTRIVRLQARLDHLSGRLDKATALLTALVVWDDERSGLPVAEQASEGTLDIEGVIIIAEQARVMMINRTDGAPS